MYITNIVWLWISEGQFTALEVPNCAVEQAASCHMFWCPFTFKPPRFTQVNYYHVIVAVYLISSLFLPVLFNKISLLSPPNYFVSLFPLDYFIHLK